MSTTGEPRSGTSSYVAIDGDGGLVVFTSNAADLVPDDTNASLDVFVRDREAGTTERVSVSSDGAEAQGSADQPAISADGRFVAFSSDAPNLVPDDANGKFDTFVHDRETGTTERVSVSSAGTEVVNPSFGAPTRSSLSGQGRFVAFSTGASLVADDANDAYDVYVRDRQRGTTERVSAGRRGADSNGGSLGPSLSADGRYVAFDSYASNLVPGDTNGASDVFVRDRVRGTIQRVSVGSRGEQAIADSDESWLSGDGRFVVFESDAPNLVPGDRNGERDVFVHDRLRRTTERVSVGPRGEEANDFSFMPSISGQGRFVAFASVASNLVPGDTNGALDVFVRDRQKQRTERVSLGRFGEPANRPSFRNCISTDGRSVVFGSIASNLVARDVNDAEDVFVRLLRRAR